jgi:hypothetical protein
MAGGWIKLYWQTKDSAVGASALATGVWVHLLLRVSRVDRILPTGDRLGRGQVWFSERTLASELQVSRRLLRKFLVSFETLGMVKTEKRDRAGTVLTICQWGTYQNTRAKAEPQRYHSGTTAVPKRDHSGTTAVPKRDRNETHTEIPKSPKKERERECAASPQLAPLGGLDEVRAYWAHAGLKGKAGQFYDYNETRGWAGVKNWQAAARVWSSRQKDFDGEAMAGRIDLDLTIPAKTEAAR